VFTSFSTALSALSATSTAIDVVGNNLANLNTPGFKTSTVSFHDLVTQSLGAGLGETQVGFGVGRPVTLRQFSQGALQTTAGPLDAAIQGDGFFVINAANGSEEYTRGGNFQVDDAGDLMTATGEKLQGWTMDNTGTVNLNAPINNITVPVGSLNPPQLTKTFSFDLNLDASAVFGSAAATFSTSINVYDSLGTQHVVSATFTKDKAVPGKWAYSIAVPGGDFSSGKFTAVTGAVQFDSDGKLTGPKASDKQPQITLTGLKDGASTQTVVWNLYNSNTTPPTPRLTQYAQPSAVAADAQDGKPAAQLVKVGLSDGGQILAQYSNGQQMVVGQLAMATIRNPESLIAVGNNNYQLSARTALPAIGIPGTGGRGTVLGGAVEASTVDIAQEFTNLIVFQRGYEANAKVVTTVDQLSQDTINLKQG
jgi:flagellar hook protein FlgE